MEKFKVGDRVINTQTDDYAPNRGKSGTVTLIDHYTPAIYHIKYDDGNEGSGEGLYYQLITNKTIMTKALEFYRNITASAEEKLLKKFGLEDPIGTPTAEGLALAQEIIYKTVRPDIIKIAQGMEEEEIKAKK